MKSRYFEAVIKVSVLGEYATIEQITSEIEQQVGSDEQGCTYNCEVKSIKELPSTIP